MEDNEDFKAWSCPEKRDKTSKYCVFHNSEVKEWDAKVVSRFAKKVKDAEKEFERNKSSKLMCIGFFFPSNFSFTLLDLPTEKHSEMKKDENRRNYKIPVYLSDAIFNGQVEFSYCTFEESLNLSGAIFKRQVLFRKTEFLGRFYPRNAKFYDNVNFWKAFFLNADFHDTLFYDKANFHGTKFDGVKTRFLDVRFQGKANFEDTKFYVETEFTGTTFKEANFSQNVRFDRLAKFRSVVFETGESIDFGVIDLRNVSFIGTEITRVKFHDDAKWGGEDSLTVLDERELRSMKQRLLLNWEKFPDEEMYKKQLIDFLVTRFGVTSIHLDSEFKKSPDNKSVTIFKTYKNPETGQLQKTGIELGSIVLDYEKLARVSNGQVTYYDFFKSARLTIGGVPYYEFIIRKESNDTNLFYSNYPLIESVKAIYRGLRENYEYRLRYDEAGKFFVKEMELKRIYNSRKSEIFHKEEVERLDFPRLSRNLVRPKKNNILIRNIFSLAGWYRILALYGEDLLRPLIAGTAIIIMSTIFWLVQVSPSGEPSLTTVGLANATNSTVWTMAFERTMADFLPILSSPTGVSVGLIDFIIKIVGGAITFGLLAIGLRRRFERRFRH